MGSLPYDASDHRVMLERTDSMRLSDYVWPSSP